MIGVGQQSAPPQSTKPPDPNDPTVVFLSKVVGGTEGVWAEVLPKQAGVKYQPAPLVIYEGATRSGCGGAQSAMGPFYCPIDKKVYLDTSFFRDMKAKYGGGGDFAYSYVVAHEIGHHVQDLLGILDKVDNIKQRVSQTQANAYSVRVELQADCLAGVWANHADAKWQILQPGDVEKALATAQAIGDDRLQTSARGYAVPDSFTHGSAAERQKWLTAGLKSGDIRSCDTFSN
jgi:predicted metalloprotease